MIPPFSLAVSADTAKVPEALLQRLESHASYERSAKKRDISKLDAIRELLGHLEHPEQCAKVVHVAGTNGKGLLTCTIGEMLRAQGFRVGCYLSPHLVDIRERIVVDGRPVPAKLFTEAAEEVLDVAETFVRQRLTYFDLLTAIAFLVFQKAGVEWMVLETGIGGTADSTNVTERKEACAISSLSFDHRDVLGKSIRNIAKAKVGICRSGTPLVLGASADNLWYMISQLLAGENVPLIRSFERLSKHNDEEGLVCWADGSCSSLGNFHLGFFEPRSVNKHALLTALCLMDTIFPDASSVVRQTWIEQGQAVRLPARMQYLQQVNLGGFLWETVLLDVGHNPGAFDAVLDELETNEEWYEEFGVILAMAKDKLSNYGLASQVLELTDIADASWLVDLPSPRGATGQELKAFVENDLLDTEGDPEDELVRAKVVKFWNTALRQAAKLGLKRLVITGSFYLIADVLKKNPEALKRVFQ
jgi:dihydrofolate synthase/folylpolyglutamate synthase